MSLFVRKPMNTLLAEASNTGGNTLKRTLGPISLVALGIGAVIGAGLFSITGMAAANYAGPGIMISFVIAAIGCAFAGLCYAEFASMIPVSGCASSASSGMTEGWLVATIMAALAMGCGLWGGTLGAR